jgi:hypothetical protein
VAAAGEVARQPPGDTGVAVVVDDAAEQVPAHRAIIEAGKMPA